MKHILFILAVNLAAIICVSAAIYLAYHDKPGSTWGWFLFSGFCLAVSPSKFPDSK